MVLAKNIKIRFVLPLRVAPFPFTPCPCGSEVPFGLPKPAFFVMIVCVSAMRVVFGWGGRPNGMVHLLVGAVSLFGEFANAARQG